MRVITLLVLAAACSSSPGREARIEKAVRTLCGERYSAKVTTYPYEKAAIKGCRPDGDLPGIHGWYSVSDEDGKRLTVSFNGDAGAIDYATVTAAVAPLLDGAQRATVAAELPTVVPGRFRPREHRVGDAAISAATWTDDLPWQRNARLTIRFDPPAVESPPPPLATALAALGSQFGWEPTLGVVDDAVLAGWKAACRGTWTTGDVWVRCAGSEPMFWAEWVPGSRRLVRIWIWIESQGGDLAAVAEPLVRPVLDEEQRATVAPAFTTELDNARDITTVFVHSEHTAGPHFILVANSFRFDF